jgi:hypothetical protein
MKKSLLVSGLCVTAILMSQSALAEVKIRAGAGSSTYELSGDYIKAKSTYSPATVGITFSSNTSANGAYLDLSYASGTGHHDGWTYIGAPDQSFKRTDYALTGGLVFLNQNNGVAGNIYLGIKGGESTIGANSTALISSLSYTASTAWTEEKFNSAGIVFGGGASFPVAGGRAGSVGVNAGLGIMSATWKDNSAAGYSAKAKSAVGGSLGVNYTFPFSRNFGVVADYKYQSYSYNFGDTANPFTVDEKFSALTGYLYVKF